MLLAALAVVVGVVRDLFDCRLFAVLEGELLLVVELDQVLGDVVAQIEGLLVLAFIPDVHRGQIG